MEQLQVSWYNFGPLGPSHASITDALLVLDLLGETHPTVGTMVADSSSSLRHGEVLCYHKQEDCNVYVPMDGFQMFLAFGDLKPVLKTKLSNCGIILVTTLPVTDADESDDSSGDDGDDESDDGSGIESDVSL